MPTSKSKDIPTLLNSNIEPHPSVIPVILSTIKNIDKDLSKSYHTLKYRTQASRDGILQEKRKLTEARRKYMSVVSAVRKLLDSLWTRIFSYNSDDKRELETYRHVCLNWSALAGDLVHRWNSINIILCYDAARSQIEVKDNASMTQFFERARPLPVDVTIDYAFSGGLFYKSNRILKQLPNKTYWRSLITAPSAMIILMKRVSGEEFTRLQEVTIRSKKGTEEMRICGLSLRGLSFLTRLTVEVEDRIHKGFEGGIRVPWYQLTHLTLSGIYSEASDYLDILAASLLLEVCHLTLFKSPHPSRRLPVRRGIRLSMPRLREFALIGTECPVPFLLFLGAPRLENLTVKWEEKCNPGLEPGQEIADFVLASRCKLRSFSLNAKDILFSDLGRALETMDFVEELSLQISNSRSMPIVDRPLHKHGQKRNGVDGYTSRPFLPSLKSMYIHSVKFEIPVSWFVKYAQPKILLLESPERDPNYVNLDCVSFVYEDGSLFVISGRDDVTKGMLATWINAEDPSIDIFYD